MANLVRVSIYSSDCKTCNNPIVFPGEEVFCSDCSKKIKIFDLFNCDICGRFFAKNLKICGDCSLSRPEFEKHISYSLYEGIFRQMILLYKYSGIYRIKELIARCYIELFQKKMPQKYIIDYIIPVPPDKGRRREFDPVLEVAKTVAARLNIKLSKKNLVKIKKTPSQTGLTLYQRKRNLNNAFSLKQPEILRGKTILLLDDVYTTGTTVNKCSALLNKVSATVIVITLATSQTNVHLNI